MKLTLHSAWRASAPYRVRIGLNLKGLDYDYSPVDLVAGQAEQAGFDQELAADAPGSSAQRLAHADLARALGDRHQHDVHDADAAHQ